VFDRESARLDESIAAIRAGTLMQGLLERNPGEEMGWFWNIGDLPELPYGTHLAPILAQHRFQEAFKNWRDLLFMARNLEQWQQSLAVLRDMLANRRQAFAQRLPEVREKERGIDLGAADSQRHALRAEIERVQRESDVAAFADARERALQGRIDSARAIIARHPDEPAVAAARDRLRRAAGALHWQQSRQFEARLWAAQKSLAELEAQFGDAQVRAGRLAAAQRDEPGRMDAFAARIDALDARLQALVPRVAELSGRQQAALQELVVAELEQQKQRLVAHGTQARFAIAALYDRANLAKGETRGAAQ
jgi:chromosome segregation ATPase